MLLTKKLHKCYNFFVQFIFYLIFVQISHNRIQQVPIIVTLTLKVNRIYMKIVLLNNCSLRFIRNTVTHKGVKLRGIISVTSRVRRGYQKYVPRGNGWEKLFPKPICHGLPDLPTNDRSVDDHPSIHRPLSPLCSSVTCLGKYLVSRRDCNQAVANFPPKPIATTRCHH